MPDPSGPVLLGVDVGGTFTDAVLAADGRLYTAKVPSTRPQSLGVLAAAARVLAEADREPGQVGRFVHGMTVATNALLERKGARVATVTTEGFRDLLAIARQDRAVLYTLSPSRREPLVPRERCLTVRERVGPQGVEVPLESPEVERVVAEVARVAPEAVALCLLWSFLFPEHEARLAAALETALPGVPVIPSSDVAPVFREYERLSTTVVDAYVTPATRGYLDDLGRGCRDLGVTEPEIMQSNGGTIPLTRAARHAAPLLLSGPAGGAVATRLLGERLGIDALLSFDMGGTSTDCAAVRRLGRVGLLETSVERTVAGFPVRLPMADITTVSAGGGSVAWVDEGGALKVGPHSAGADPGPACYGLGGVEATVTDANVVLGRIAPGATLGGALVVHGDLARRAVARVGERAGLSLEEAAEGILRVAAFTMAAALRTVTLARGIDPRDFTLVAFGGAGGLHACALADEVGIDTILVPIRAGVLSAVGLIGSPLRVDRTVAVAWPAGAIPADGWVDAWSGLEKVIRGRLADAGAGRALRHEAQLLCEVEARYLGQSHELTVAMEPGDDPGMLASRFHEIHRQRYDYAEPETPVEAIALRVIGLLPPAAPLPQEATPVVADHGVVPVVVGGRTRPCPVLGFRELAGPIPSGAAPAGTEGERGGPLLVTAGEFSAFVAPGWRAGVVPGAMRLRRL